MAGFFIPHLCDDPAAADSGWQRYLGESSPPPDSRRVRALVYEHDGDRYEVTVRESRKRYRRRRGPRGDCIRGADYERTRHATGTIVSGIIDVGDLLHVWSYASFSGWANPSLVGPSEIRNLEYFDNAAKAAGTNTTEN